MKEITLEILKIINKHGIEAGLFIAFIIIIVFIAFVIYRMANLKEPKEELKECVAERKLLRQKVSSLEEVVEENNRLVTHFTATSESQMAMVQTLIDKIGK